MKRMPLFLLVALALSVVLSPPSVRAQANASPALSKSLEDVYLYWHKAMVGKDYRAWGAITASHRKLAIKNRILSEKGSYPSDIFNVPGAPPLLDGLKLLRARSKGVTAKLVYFGKVDFGIGGSPSDNLLVLSFLHEGRGWKYDTAEFVNLGGVKDIRSQLKSGNLSYVDGDAFLPDGKRPYRQVEIKGVKYIAKVYSYCPGREVKVKVNKISKHKFQDTQQSEVVIGGARDGMNQISYTVQNLPGYKGDDPLTLRVYIFSQTNGVKPVKVYQYQTVKGEKPQRSGADTFNISPATGAKVLRR